VRGRLISFEGLDGAGKTTLSRALAGRLEAIGVRVLWVREPGGTELGEEIRRWLLATSLRELSPMAELFLFLAARAELVHERIRPALQEGIWVLADRFWDSTVAYQAFGRHVVDAERCLELNLLATGGLRPDVTFWLDLPLEEALRRKAGLPGDRMEQADLAFFERVRDGYRWLQEREGERIVRLPASRPPEALLDAVWEVLRNRGYC
jgi:dTMP kinase